MSIPILSFFTGAGFLDLGMDKAGFDIVWRNEYHQPFVDGFRYGFSKLYDTQPDEFKVSTDSITDLTPYKIRHEAFSGKNWPDVFGVIGGPPCPDFSVAGKNLGKEGDNGKLTGVYFDQILGLMPSFFIFENVKGILSNRKNRAYLVEQLHKISAQYVFDIKLMNSLDVGAPQDRERVFIVGLHKSYLSDIADKETILEFEQLNSYLRSIGLQPKKIEKYNWFDWPYLEKFDNAKDKYSWPTTSPFGSDPILPDYLPLELCVQNCLENLAGIENQNEHFTPKSNKFTIVKEGDVSRKSFKRLHRWRYSPTAAYGNNEVHLHPYLPRRISVREAMRIQTVPDKFALPKEMTLSNKFKTIGNGVPVKLAQEIGNSLFSLFSTENFCY